MNEVHILTWFSLRAPNTDNVEFISAFGVQGVYTGPQAAQEALTEAEAQNPDGKRFLVSSAPLY